MLISYVLDGGAARPRHGRAGRAASRPQDRSSSTDVAGSGKNQLTFDQVPLDKATRLRRRGRRRHAAPAPGAASRGCVAEHMVDASTRPSSGRWSPVLADMERAGVKVDRAELQRLSQRLRRAHRGAGEPRSTSSPAAPFNIGSPKQLGEVLFDELGLGGGKKGKTGAYSTGADVLEDAGRAGPRPAGARARLAPAVEAEEHLYRRAAGRRSTPRPGASTPAIAHGGRLDRAALVDRPQPAEHPDPHRGGPQDPPRLRRRAGHAAALASTTRRSSCACSRTCRRHRRR